MMHSLKNGTLITHGGLKGRIRRRCRDRDELYMVQIYADNNQLWRIHKKYMEVRQQPKRRTPLAHR